MQTRDLIPAIEFCSVHQIEISFINSLNELGLVEITTVDQTEYVPSESLSELEKFVRLHYDLNINPEGIQAIEHLLNRVETLQEELNLLKNRIQLFED